MKECFSMKQTTYHYNGKDYTINWLTKDEWKQKMPNVCPRRYPLWFCVKFVRGFASRNEVYIKEKTKIGLERLILHEIGHLLNYNHTWKPTLMNPTWVFRWFKRF
jgi:hypothetical protein